MLLWINGPFGVGKTTTARALRALLRRRGRSAHIYDPEILGSVWQRIAPWSPADFRDAWVWQTGTAGVVHGLARCPGVWIVPMTIRRPERLAALAGPRAIVIQLTVPPDEHERRIHARPFAVEWSLARRHGWPIAGGGLEVPAVGPPEEVAHTILARISPLDSDPSRP